MSSIVDDFKDGNGLWVKSYGKAGVNQVKTRSCAKWNHIMHRCKVGGACQRKSPTYIGCTASPLFSDFQLFTDWHVQQVGYGMLGYHMDKDLLFAGNKVYSEHSCVLVPFALNMFLTASDVARGDWPQGVSFHKRDKKFTVAVSIDGCSKHIGYYTTLEAASAAYKVAKEAEAYRWYERLKAGEFVVDPRVIERMRTWKLENI